MKVRNGFVSNSSSSSFILVVSTPNICNHCGRGDGNVLDMMTNYLQSGNAWAEDEIICLGKEEVIEQFKNYYFDYDDSDNKTQIINKIQAIDETKNQIAYITISRHNNYLIDLIEDSKNVEILHRSHD